ncbi:hypothetical protein CF253_22420 [Salmonella enterica]|nr:hypothetical protein [Salmonella enterica]EBS8686819.1 hypothetical protein [Salmonella enterica]EBT3583778.1 hypothetical protein [Salmonella enterica]EBT5382154.1 hypothetical protein [Salmonella enterica]EEN5997205.1 hypothetical protein [Salmonella enterica]
MEEMKGLKKSIYLSILFFLCGAGCYLFNQQYKMYVLTPTDDIDSFYWPNEKVWFDASEWLKEPQYKRIDGKYLLNLQYISIENHAEIISALWRKKSDWRNMPELNPLKRMERKNFEELMRNKLTSEYLFTRFDNISLLPDTDYFLVNFSYKDKKYEVLVIRNMVDYKGEKTCLFYVSDIERAGYWYNKKNPPYSHRDYMAGKKIPTCWSCYLSFSPQIERLAAESVW